MNREDIIRMAQEAGLTKVIDCCSVPYKFCGQDQWKGDINAFAVLVAAAERNRTWTQEHWTEYERSIAAAEREACAKVCDELFADVPAYSAPDCAAAIRARSNAE